jgi:heparinase II/III-like protein
MPQTSRRTRASQSKLRRLLHMGLPELACRSRQEAFKWVERIHSSADVNSIRLTRRVVHRESLSRFLRNAEECFFPGPLDSRLPGALALAAPDHYKDVPTTADKLLRGTFDLLGYRDLDFGKPPDWHLDPVSGCQAPFVHWTRLDPLDYTVVGDSKVIWELNRHQWFVHLGQAYRLTRDERYAWAVVRYLQAWLRANPPGMGINWSSSLEVSFRLISWCWTLLLIRDSRALTPDLFAVILESVRAHATHIERYLSHYFSPNTHLTGEALGLLYAGILFPELKRAERLRSLATHILVQQIERQVLADGVYFERSTCYQRYTVDIYLHYLILASRAGLEVPEVVKERLLSMLDFLVKLRQPDGSMPNIGDADGGWVLPLSGTKPDDFCATFSTAAVVFGSPVYAWAAGKLAPDTLWLLGTSAVETFESIEVSPPPASDACQMFPVGGVGVMRSGWDESSHSLIFDTGPLGCSFSSGHGHADLLSIQCSVFGQQYLVDGGTCCYTANPELRDFSRGTAAHSTVMIDGKSQAEPAGPFAWQRRSTIAELLQWISNETLAFADAEHDGYGGLPDPVSHRRRVIFVKPRYWLVIDDLMGQASHGVDIRFQFAPMKVRIDGGGWVRATLDGRHGLLMRTFASAPMEADIREGCRTPLEGWLSPNYGQLEPAPVLVYSMATELPVRVVTLLWPSESVYRETPRVRVVRETEGRVSAVEFPELAETVVFHEEKPVLERGVLLESRSSR